MQTQTQFPDLWSKIKSLVIEIGNPSWFSKSLMGVHPGEILGPHTFQSPQKNIKMNFNTELKNMLINKVWSL